MEGLKWNKKSLILLDQTKLPFVEEYIECTSHKEVADSIVSMVVRGAPAIGAAAAFGIVLSSKEKEFENITELKKHLKEATKVLHNTRPTAVNLFWALHKMECIWNSEKYTNASELKDALEKEAIAIFNEDILLNKSIGKYGLDLIPDACNILTHCNAGALATAGFGTALGVIRAAFYAGKKVKVFADETRPLLQGARLTVTELLKEGIDVTLITDSMAGYFMKQGKIDLIIVGADRIAANGDVANKIGTYSLAVLAKYHNIPFYVAAPYSTFDLNLSSGREIPIEERNPVEVRSLGGVPIVPENVPVKNPAFDVTPHELITAIITDKGVLKDPYEKSLKFFEGDEGNV